MLNFEYMANRSFLFLIFVWLLLFSCKKEGTSPPIKTQVKEKGISVNIHLDKMRIYAGPKLDSEQMGTVPMGTSLPYAGQMTETTTKMKLGGVWYDEPWVSIQTPKGDTAWIYGGGVMLQGEDSEELAEILLEKRMMAFFGNATKDLMTYRENYANASTSEAFAEVFHDGEELRDRLVGMLEQKIPTAQTEDLPDIFWVEDVFPGYVVELVAEGTKYFLFKDYKQLYLKARQTEGEEDDIFTDLGLEVYSQDSIEYFFPSWFIQTWDYGGHSLLGSGKHNDIIALADEVSGMTDLFSNDINIIKRELLKDITHPEITYWNSREKIINELDSIIDLEYDILSREDLVALESRYNQFKEAEKNGIELNIRTGK